MLSYEIICNISQFSCAITKLAPTIEIFFITTNDFWIKTCKVGHEGISCPKHHLSMQKNDEEIDAMNANKNRLKVKSLYILMAKVGFDMQTDGRINQ